MSSGVDPYGGILGPTIAQAKAIQRATGKPFFAALHEARGTAPDAAAVRQAEELYRQGVAEIDAKRAAERPAVSTTAAVDRAQRIMAAEPSVNFMRRWTVRGVRRRCRPSIRAASPIARSGSVPPILACRIMTR